MASRSYYILLVEGSLNDRRIRLNAIDHQIRIDFGQRLLRGAFWQVGIGLGIGIPAAIAAGYLMASQLFGVTPWNPLLLGGATVLLGLAAFVAAVIPAQKAASITPMQALRSE